MWMPATICMVLMIFTGFKALSVVSVSLFTLFKNNTLILIAIAERYLFGRTISITSGISFVLMVISSVLMAHNDSAKSLNWLIFNVLISGVYVLVLRWTVLQYGKEKQRDVIDLETLEKKEEQNRGIKKKYVKVKNEEKTTKIGFGLNQKKIIQKNAAQSNLTQENLARENLAQKNSERVNLAQEDLNQSNLERENLSQTISNQTNPNLTNLNQENSKNSKNSIQNSPFDFQNTKTSDKLEELQIYFDDKHTETSKFSPTDGEIAEGNSETDQIEAKKVMKSSCQKLIESQTENKQLSKTEDNCPNTSQLEKNKIQKTQHHTIIFSESRTKPVTSKKISDIQKKFESSQDSHSNDTNDIYEKAQSLNIPQTRYDLEFSALAYTQFLSIPFLLILSLLFDNFKEDPIFKDKFSSVIADSPDFLDNCVLTVLTYIKHKFFHRFLNNILLIKAFVFDLHDLTVSYVSEELFILLLFSSISIFFVALSSIKIISLYSSTTLSMLGAINKVLLSLSDFRTEIHEMAGVIIGCVASVLYADTLRKE